MINFLDFLKNEKQFKKFELNDILFVEYNCPIEKDSERIWTHSDSIIHVLSGKKVWETVDGSWDTTEGETLYFKKGSAVINQFFDNEFCMIGFFIPDDLIRETVNQLRGKTPIPNDPNADKFSIVRVETDLMLEGFYNSMLSYVSQESSPAEDLLRLKGKELIMNIMNNEENSTLSSYFNFVAQSSKPSLPHIMEANYCYNLSLDEFAKLCHRSKSSFKRDFENHYSTSPGRWILNKRLERSATLLKSGATSISEIAYDCGFENASHFSRSFKNKFGENPRSFISK